MSFRTGLFCLAFLTCGNLAADESFTIDAETGLVIDDNWQLVLGNCSSCHSLKLVTQNRMSAESWSHTIRWMQEKHNLWDLGENETAIVAYLEKHYGIPERPHRRQPLNQAPINQEVQP